VLTSKGQGAFGQDQDDVVLAPYTTVMRRLVGSDSLRDITISAEDGYGMESITVAVEDLLRARHNIPPGGADDFSVRTQEEIAGVLTLGSASGITSTLIARALAGLRNRHPRLKFRIEEGLTDQLIARVRRRELDAAVITQTLVPEPDMRTLPITEEPLLVVAPRAIVDKGWRKVLTGRPFLRLNRRSGVGALIDVTLREAGVAVQEAMELDNSESVVGLVAAGLGVGVVPAGRVRVADTSRLRTLPFGTLVSIPGYNGGRPVPVLDRGGKIKGHRLDLLYPTHEIALQWGAQPLTVDVGEYAD